MPLAKYTGLSYPTHILKSRVVLLGIILLNTELTSQQFGTNYVYTLFATNIAKHILYRHFSFSHSDTCRPSPFSTKTKSSNSH